MSFLEAIEPLWISPEHAKIAPIILSDVQFAQELLTSYNASTTMSKKRTFDETREDIEPEQRNTTRMTFFESVTGALSSIATSFLNLFTTRPAQAATPEPISTYTIHVGGAKRRLVEIHDPSLLTTPPTPLAAKYRIPGSWPATSETPQVLTLENAQAAWATASLDERKRIIYGDSSIPYWRRNNLPPHFPYNDLDQMLEYKYLRSADPEEWDRKNFNQYRPTIGSRFNLYNTAVEVENSTELPRLTHPIYLPIKPLSRNEKLASLGLPTPKPQTYTDERIANASSYRPFTNIRRASASTSLYRPTTVEEITNKIKHYKSIRERRDFDRAHPGVLFYEKYARGEYRRLKPKGYDALQKAASYNYSHGQNRPARSVLKTSKPPATDDVDISMNDADTLRVHWPATSQFTGRLIAQPTKVFNHHEPANAPTSKTFTQYREHTPINDDSILDDDTPKRYYGHEQDNEPTYAGEDEDLVELAEKWAAQTRLQAEKFRRQVIRWSDPDADPDITPSRAFQQRFARNHEKTMAMRQETQNQLLAKIAERHEQERKVRAAEAAKKAEEERRVQEALAHKAKALLEARIKEAKTYHEAISLVKPLSDEWSAKVNAAMATEDKAAIIIPKHYISRHDLGTILPQQGIDSSLAWLNDQIVNGSLKQMVDHALALEKQNKTKPAKYWAANSNWHSTVVKSRRGDGITRWLGKRGVNLQGKNLLEAEAIFLPVCSGNHWTLVVVKPKQRIIEYLDSLSNKREDDSKIRVALMFLEHELGKDFDIDEWRSVFNRSPQQNNGVDCGAFVIMNAMATIRGYEPLEWVNPNRMYEARRSIVAHLMNGGYTGEFAWMEKTLEMPSSYKEMLAAQAKI